MKNIFMIIIKYILPIAVFLLWAAGSVLRMTPPVPLVALLCVLFGVGLIRQNKYIKTLGGMLLFVIIIAHFSAVVIYRGNTGQDYKAGKQEARQEGIEICQRATQGIDCIENANAYEKKTKTRGWRGYEVLIFKYQ